jgi:hypothetical protein
MMGFFPFRKSQRKWILLPSVCLGLFLLTLLAKAAMPAKGMNPSAAVSGEEPGETAPQTVKPASQNLQPPDQSRLNDRDSGKKKKHKKKQKHEADEGHQDDVGFEGG